MLVSAKEMLMSAVLGGYAVVIARANYSNETIGAIMAAEEKHAPMILELRPDRAGKDVAGAAYLAWLKAACETSSAPLAISCEMPEMTDDAVRGVTDAGASLICAYDSPHAPPLDKASLIKVAESAHNRGAAFAVKLGGPTEPVDPMRARSLIEELGLDCLTVELNMESPAGKTLDLERLEALRMEIGKMFPLILHGLSGLAPETVHQGSRQGICALNISKDCWGRVKELIKETGMVDPFALSLDAVHEKLMELIDISGSTGKA